MRVREGAFGPGEQPLSNSGEVEEERPKCPCRETGVGRQLQRFQSRTSADQGSHLFTPQFTRHFGPGLPTPQAQCCLLGLPPHPPAGRRQTVRCLPGSLLVGPTRGAGGWWCGAPCARAVAGTPPGTGYAPGTGPRPHAARGGSCGVHTLLGPGWPRSLGGNAVGYHAGSAAGARPRPRAASVPCSPRWGKPLARKGMSSGALCDVPGGMSPSSQLRHSCTGGGGEHHVSPNQVGHWQPMSCPLAPNPLSMASHWHR